MTAIAPAVRQQAIAWLVESRSGAMTSTQHQALARWRSAHPAHEAAWAQVSGALDHALQPLEPFSVQGSDSTAADAALGALLQPDRRKRRLVGGSLAVAGAAFAGLLAHRITPLPGLLADAHTATAERRTVALADGSRLLLDARTAVDIAIGPGSRRVHLRQGALIAEVAPDAATRPFAVHTRHGEAHALGTRCMVRVQDERTQVAALAQAVALHASDGLRKAVVAEGQGAWIDAHGTITPTPTPAADLAAWQRGMLALQDGTLADVVEALRPYRRGFIRVSPAAARLPVLGVFPLDDTDHTLQALADTLPITVRRYQGGWMVAIDLA